MYHCLPNFFKNIMAFVFIILGSTNSAYSDPYNLHYNPNDPINPESAFAPNGGINDQIYDHLEQLISNSPQASKAQSLRSTSPIQFNLIFDLQFIAPFTFCEIRNSSGDSEVGVGYDCFRYPKHGILDSIDKLFGRRIPPYLTSGLKKSSRRGYRFQLNSKFLNNTKALIRKPSFPRPFVSNRKNQELLECYINSLKSVIAGIENSPNQNVLDFLFQNDSKEKFRTSNLIVSVMVESDYVPANSTQQSPELELFDSSSRRLIENFGNLNPAVLISESSSDLSKQYLSWPMRSYKNLLGFFSYWSRIDEKAQRVEVRSRFSPNRANSCDIFPARILTYQLIMND
jgi:hypothetical protein